MIGYICCVSCDLHLFSVSTALNIDRELAVMLTYFVTMKIFNIHVCRYF